MEAFHFGTSQALQNFKCRLLDLSLRARRKCMDFPCIDDFFTVQLDNIRHAILLACNLILHSLWKIRFKGFIW